MKLHTREEVETSDAAMPISRYRVPGGWLYHAHPDDARNGGYAALCFVPDTEEVADARLYEGIFGKVAA